MSYVKTVLHMEGGGRWGASWLLGRGVHQVSPSQSGHYYYRYGKVRSLSKVVCLIYFPLENNINRTNHVPWLTIQDGVAAPIVLA
jgi:hypothetical protein